MYFYTDDPDKLNTELQAAALELAYLRGEAALAEFAENQARIAASLCRPLDMGHAVEANLMSSRANYRATRFMDSADRMQELFDRQLDEARKKLDKRFEEQA